ncbi:hypothetical protein ACROYT_G015373 [Oculina patagonica]
MQDIAIPLEDLVKPEDDTLHSAVDTSLPIETYQLFAIIVKSEEERYYACIRTGGEASDKYVGEEDDCVIIQDTARQPALLNLELCINDIQAFFLTYKLVCNPTKTEVLHLTSRFTRHPPLSNISFGVNIVSCANKARNLGSVFDRHLTMTSHVNNICRHASLALRNIGRVRKYISQSSTERLVHAFITSKLDYCNSLLYGLPSTELQKLQRIQNTAARLVVKAKRTDHISPILQQLHWLPVSECISFKILLFTYKAMNGYAPSYIVDLLDQYILDTASPTKETDVVSSSESSDSGYDGPLASLVTGPAQEEQTEPASAYTCKIGLVLMSPM